MAQKYLGDEKNAERIRNQLGMEGWLISWAELPGGRWLARVSCEDHYETLEAHAPTRCKAIRKASMRLLEAMAESRFLASEVAFDFSGDEDPEEPLEDWQSGAP